MSLLPRPSLFFPMLLPLVALPARAQLAAQAASSPADNPASAPVELAPFEIRADKDEGYLAQNTASGSRLNTNLKDTPAAVSVFTKEFIVDIGATDLTALSDYAVNAGRNYGFVGDVANGNEFSTNDTVFKVRGLPVSGGRMVDFFNRTIEVDMFDTERVEFSRGPNAVLFGLGSPGGTFNVTTKKADMNRRFDEVSYRFGSYEQARGTLDLNQPIVPGKLALRLNLLDDQKNTWRPIEFSNSRRGAAAVKYQPFHDTEVTGNYERGRINQSLQRPWASFDSYTTWAAAGKQLDPVKGTPIPANAGLQNISTSNYFVYESNSKSVSNQQNQSRTAPVASPTGDSTATGNPMLFDFSVVPRNVVLGGPGLGSDIDYQIATALVSQKLADNLYAEFGFYHQRTSYLGRDIGNTEVRIIWDTNAQLPSGTPNPNAGRPYVEGLMNQRNRWEDISDGRLTLSYEFKAGKILGHHRIAGLWEERDEQIATTNPVERIVQNPNNATDPTLGVNALHRRTYVDLGGPAGTIALADFRVNPVNGIVNSGTNLPVSSAFVTQTGARDDRSHISTVMGVAQSYFWDDRIVTTLGARQDHVDTYSSTSVRGPAFGPFSQGGYYAVRNSSPDSTTGNTLVEGIVFHALPSISVFYNHSSSFTLPNRSIILIPNRLAPSPHGVGDDGGLKFTLLQNKLYATVTYYRTSARQDSASLNVDTTTGNLNNIWQTLSAAGRLPSGTTLDQLLVNANGYLIDSDSKGWEAELIANPLPNLRLSVGFSDNRTIQSNLGTELLSYLTKYHDPILAGTNGRLVLNGTGQLAANATDPNDGLTTVAEALASVESDANTRLVQPNGALALGQPRYQANARTNYIFTLEKLRGLSVGAGARWRGTPVLGYSSSDPATRQAFFGADRFLADFNLGYRGRNLIFNRRFEWSVQLNINNVFNKDSIIITRVYSNGQPRTYQLPDPRQWFATTTLRF